MGHNSVVSDHTKSTGIPGVNGLSMGSPDYVCVYLKLNYVDNFFF